MEISVADAEGQLTDLVLKAEAGDEVVLTRHGQPTVRLVPIRAKANAGKFDPAKRRALMEAIAKEGAARATPGPSAARSQDFLYDDGMPG
ncbi:type II toxin-antitoxin system prevent-host-death family antitoxin [Caulobacter sp. 602-2]|uniref:Type II toxin-antitoxin system prevent-host-death family antitoxin n=1 Tax=Caulobacter sp. 602-2 TaxID=2710887 RepID=A0A6G4QW82_9CAUL|nr:type II toxin-antitoxin system prevent-host-death family antitoxin [Caulobacter sp. 602-2]NGM49906.1 type II toxin-antitoxin system prevent-host-death family antitoxin [Caulobacter sp. 602-2]